MSSKINIACSVDSTDASNALTAQYVPEGRIIALNKLYFGNVTHYLNLGYKVTFDCTEDNRLHAAEITVPSTARFKPSRIRPKISFGSTKNLRLVFPTSYVPAEDAGLKIEIVGDTLRVSFNDRALGARYSIGYGIWATMSDGYLQSIEVDIAPFRA